MSRIESVKRSCIVVCLVVIAFGVPASVLWAESPDDPVRSERARPESQDSPSISERVLFNADVAPQRAARTSSVGSYEELLALEAMYQNAPQEKRIDLEVWNEIEHALRKKDWVSVRSLIEELPNWRSSFAVERLLEMIPIERQAPEKGAFVSISEEEEAAILAEEKLIQQRDFDRMAAVRAMGPPSIDEPLAPDYSTEGRLPHHLGPIAPGSDLASRAPDVVLTVGDSCTYANLQAAIDAAATNDTIWVQGKIFTGTNSNVNINAKTLTIYGGLNATCTGTDGSVTVMDGSGVDDTLFEIYGGSGGLSVQLIDFELKDAAPFIDLNGGGLDITSDYAVTLTRTLVYNNTARYGGGVYMTAGTLTIQDSSQVSANFAYEDGGGVYATGGTINLESCYIGSLGMGGNTADSDSNASGNGGGVFLDGGVLNVGASTESGWVRNNNAQNGGGIYSINSGSTVNLMGDGVGVDFNDAVADGGGIYISTGADAWGDSCDINSNTAGDDGGAGYASGAGSIFDLDLYLCGGSTCGRVYENSAGGWGGAFYVDVQAELDLEGIQVNNNTAVGYGAVVYGTSAGTLVEFDSVMMWENSVSGNYLFRLNYCETSTIKSSTMADNTGLGLAVFGLANGALTTQNLIVWGNDGTDLFSGTSTFAITDSIDQYGYAGTNNLNEDPLFLDAAGDNYHISTASPAVDHSATGFGIDVDNEARPFGSDYDAGADEAYDRVGINGALCSYPTITDAIAAASAGDTIYIPAGNYYERFEIDKNLSLTQSLPDCSAADPGGSLNNVMVDAQDASASLGGVAAIQGGATVNFTRMQLRNGTATYGGILYVDAGCTVNLYDTWLGFGTSATHGGGVRLWGTLNMYGESSIWSCSVTGTGLGGGVSVPSTGHLNLYDSSSIGHSTGFGNSTETTGGGIYMLDGASMTMNDSAHMVYNTAVGNGGAIYATGVGTEVTLNDSSYLSYNTTNDDGGGIAATDGATVLVDGGRITYNHSVAGGYNAGGGLFVRDGLTNPVTVTFTNNATVDNNDADDNGGGVYFNSDSGSSTLTVTAGASVDSNTSAGASGGIRWYSSGLLAITNGATVSTNDATFVGGGIGVDSGIIQITDASVDNNVAATNGGGIYCAAAGTVRVDADVTAASVSGNTATGGSGGGIYSLSSVGTRLWANVSPKIIVDGNTAGVDGGGLWLQNAAAYLDSYGLVEITNNVATGNGGGFYYDGPDSWLDDSGALRVLISGNTAANGGGAYLINVSETGHFFDGVDIEGNTASSDDGGGIYANASTFFMNNCMVDGNQSYDVGGGLYAINASNVTIRAGLGTPTSPVSGKAPVASSCNPASLAADTYCSMFVNNSTGAGTNKQGAGVYIQGGSTLTASDTAFMNNTIGGSGGAALYSLSTGDTMSLTNCRVSGNTGPSAIRIFSDGAINLDNTTFAGNSALAVHIVNSGATATFNSNIFWDNGGGVDSAASIAGNSCNISQNGIGGLALDPQFTTTSRGDYHLGTGSPAVDVCGTGPDHDLDNVARPIGSNFDMGCFEAPLFESPIFADGFESGNYSMWSSVLP